jgi:hypothetical protein
MSVLHLFSVPIGTALGVYGLWVLFQPEAKQVLEAGLITSVPVQRPGPPLASA